MNLLILLVSLVASAPQEAPEDATQAASGADVAETDGTQWTLVAGIAAQAGDRILTLAELEAFIESRATSRSITPNDPTFARLAWDVLEQALTAELEPQAGRDIGLDAEGVDQFVSQQLRHKQREVGATGFVDHVLGEGTSFQELEQSERAKAFQQIWQSYRLGGSALPGMRPIRDRHVRPGELRTIFETNRERLNPDIIQFQSIFAPVSAFGDEASARRAMEDVRRRALDGEDFGLLLDEFGAITQDEQGIGAELPVPDIALPELKAFARTAVVGDISPIVDVDGNGAAYLMIARVHAKTENVTPEFGEGDIQQILRRTFSKERDYRRLDLERQILRRRSYVWITPRLGELRAAAQRASGGR